MNISSIKGICRFYSSSYRTLIYEGGKAKLLESGDIHGALIIRHSITLGSGSYMLQRLIGSYSTGSWTTILLELAALSGLGVDLYYSLRSSSRIIKELSILDDGKRFEIKTMSLFGIGRSKLFDIESIIQPEVPIEHKDLPESIKPNTITVSKDHLNLVFIIEPYSVIYNKEALLRVMQGVPTKPKLNS